MAERGLSLPLVVLFQPFFFADTNMLAEQPHRFFWILAHDRSENLAVVAVNLDELSGVMPLAQDSEDIQQDARVRDDFQDSGVGCRSDEPRMELQIDPNEPPHPLSSQMGLAGRFEFIA